VPGQSPQSATVVQITNPDQTFDRIYFLGTSGTDSGWRVGLPFLVESYDIGGSIPQRQVVTTWTQDDETSLFVINPRVSETNVYDTSGNRKRTETVYQPHVLGNGMTCQLPEDIREYDANASSVLRTTRTVYEDNAAYLSRRIIGLPKHRSVYEGLAPSGILRSKLEFIYDTGSIEGTEVPAQHDNANYSASFVVGRGNLTSVLRYDVENQTQFTTTTYKYNRAGSLVSSKDALGHEVMFIYTDAFATNAGPTEANPLDPERPFKTLAYPTEVKDPDGYSTKLRYNYDFGALTWRQTPLPNVTTNTPGPVQTFSYDVIGRPIRTTTLTNNAFTRYIYGPNYVETFSSINTIVESANEGHRLVVFDGFGRTIASASDHPNSTGGFSAQLTLYDRMGRVQKQSNPTETSIPVTANPINPTQFAPLGDDALPNGGWNYVQQTYDWKGRPLVTTNQDGTTKTAEYTGCGCAGGEVVTLTDEGTIDGGVPKRRQQKIYSDVLGRVVKTEVLNWQNGAPYSTTVNTYNARDQVTQITEYAGLGGSSTYQDTTMTYDGYGRLLSEHRPEQDVGTSTTYAYNADDTVLSVTDARGAAATYAYNGRHLTTGVTYSASGGISIPAPVTYGYDAASNRSWMNENGLRRVTYHYTMLSLMDWEDRQFPGLSGVYRLSYDYNLVGQIKTITDPTNSAINYARDSAGRVMGVTGTPYGTGGINGAPYIEISQYASNLKYRAWGSLRSLTYGNQMTLSQEFDRRLRLSSFLVGGMTLPPNAPPGWETRLRSSTFQYYDDGSLRASLDNLGNVMDRAYSYDHVNRAKEAYSGSEALDFLNGTNSGPPTGTYRQSYQFDPFGNMTSRTNRFWSQTDTFTATFSNKRRQGSNFTYDADGNLTHDADLEYTYDAAGRSASIFNPATNKTISPVYDGDSQVVNRTEIEGTSTSLNFFQLRSTVMGGTVTTELDSQGQKRKGFVYCNGQLIARQEHLWIVWQHDDPFTGARAGSNRDGAGAVDLDPDPMGVDLGSADPYVEPQLWEPPPEGMVGLLPGSGIPSGRCMLDGMSIECRQAGHLLQIGAAEFEHPTTVWDNGSWHFVEFNRKTGEYETRIDEERLDAGGRELIDYLKRKIDSSANHVVRQFGLYYSISQNPQNPAPHEPAAGQTLSQADCDKKIAAIFGGPGAVAATVNEPSTLQHPSAGRDRYDHLAGNGVFHLYTNAQGTEGTVGLYTPSGFIGRPVTGTVYNGPNDPSPGEVNYNYERFTYRGGLQISFVHAGNPGVNRNDRNAMGSVRVGNIAGPGGEGAGYNHTHVNVYLNGKRVDPRSIFCK
jgi:YD repeat-containing protein